jgi:uroporphyrinogen III methyltransferase / synthase
MGLAGKNILVTRAASQSAQLRDALSRLGARVIECPTIQIEPVADWTDVDRAISELNSYQWLLFTSANAVEYFMQRYEAVAHGQLATPIAVVGPATGKKLEGWNLKAFLEPESYSAEGLLVAFPENLNGVRILFPRAETAREILPDELRRRGANVDVLTVYRTVKAESLSDFSQILAGSQIDCAVFTSPSSIHFMAEALKDQFNSFLKDVPIAVIGPVTRDAVQAFGLQVKIQPQRSTIEELIEEIRAFFA